LACDLALVTLGGFHRDIESLAMAHAISLCVAFAVGAIAAMRDAAVRPSLRDVAVIAAATFAMAAAIRPLNQLGSPLLAAGLALTIGVILVGGAILLFDVAGLRRLAVKFLRGRELRPASPLPRSP
jgi:hypothetical protein